MTNRPAGGLERERTPLRHVSLVERRARIGRRHLLDRSTPEWARLSGSSPEHPARVVIDALAALHSTDPATVVLSVAMRSPSPAATGLDSVLFESRSALRHHSMRRTLWVMTCALSSSAHAACTRDLAAREWKLLSDMLRASGVQSPSAWIAAAKEDIANFVSSAGTATARQIGVGLPHLNVRMVLASGKAYEGTQGAHTRVLQNLGFDGVLVRTRQTGGITSGEYRWAVAKDWVSSPIDDHSIDARTGAATLLAAYLARCGPVTTNDVRWWCGWTLARTRQALADVGAVPVTADSDHEGGRVDAWLGVDDLDVVEPGSQWMALLPSLDPTSMGWKDRDWYAHGSIGRLGSTVFDRMGNAGNAIWVDGRIAGSWAQRANRSVVLEWLDRVPADVQTRAGEEVERYLTAVGETVVKPRFPAPISSRLINP